jgi:hypothetical protein
MFELAFDREGQPFRFSRRTKKLRPRRWKNAGQRGTCAAVLDPDGEPLLIDADAEYLEFRAAVGNVPGFYRLDQVDEDGAPIEDAPPAYVSIESTRNAVPVGEVDPRDAIIRDLAQINADVIRTIAERFANVMQATADVLRAADGAGLSRREPPPLPPPPPPEDEDEEGSEPAPPAQPFGPLQPLVEMAMPHLPTFGAFLWEKFQEFRKQNATPAPVAAPHSAPSPAHGPVAAEAPSPGPEPGSMPSAAATSTAPAPSPPSPPSPSPPPVPSADAAPAADALGGAGSVAPTPSIAPSPIAPSPSVTPSTPTTAVGAHPAAMAPPRAAAPSATSPDAASSTSPRLDSIAPSATTSDDTTLTDAAQGDAPRNALGTAVPTPQQCAHLRAVLVRLSPRESAITETVVGRMPPEVRVQWLAELSALGVDQAVEAVRSMIPKAPAKPQTTNSATAKPPQAKPGSADSTAAVELPPLSSQATAHFLAIQAALTPEEAASVRAAASALSPLELRALVDEFSAMSVPEAVERIRALLAGASNPEAA